MVIHVHVHDGSSPAVSEEILIPKECPVPSTPSTASRAHQSQSCPSSVTSTPQPSVPDTWATICFPRRLVARPRLAHGFRKLDVGNHANIRVKSTYTCLTESWVDCHIASWHDTRLYGAVNSMLVLAPGDLDFLTGQHWRTAGDPSAVRVDFERRFVTPPRVVAFFNCLDLDKSRNWRLSVSASNVDVAVFTLHMETWGDTILYGVQACWVAYPEDREHIFSTSVSTMDLHTGTITTPQPSYRRDVTFDKVPFSKTPSVFVALNYIDCDCQANLRVIAYADQLSTTGLVCHIDSWMDSLMWAAGASVIAFD